MNTSIRKPIQRMLSTLLLLMAATAAAAQSQPQVIEIPLSRPGEAMTLEIDIQSARIEVIGEDRDDVSFEVSVSGGSRRIITPSGAKEIASGSFAFEIDEDDNEVSMDADWRANKVSVIARIPRRADVALHTINDGELIISNVTGNIELYNVNGPITASNISGSVIAESINDTIDVGFSSIDEINVSSFESINGDLIVRLPAGLGIEAHLDSARGEITSDFEVDVLPSTGRVERDDDDNGVSIRIENVIVARINGGGPVLRMKTLHGDIHFGEAR